MRAVVQRVASAEVRVAGQRVAAIGTGLLVLLGVCRSDTERECAWMADKLLNLRIFDDEDGKLNRSVMEVGGEVLVVSNFTVCGNAQKGRRPEFTQAASFDDGKVLFERFVQMARSTYAHVEVGVFGEQMQVSLVNDGPVTLVVDSP